MSTTLDYYELNAEVFAERTQSIDMEDVYARFLRYLPKHAKILDFGCGAGRDLLNFKNKGFEVEGTDFSQKMVHIAQQHSGAVIRCESFNELDEFDKYEGIWACASLLHAERHELPHILTRIFKALKHYGVCYLSFKYGTQDRDEGGRHFIDMDEQQIHELLKSLNPTNRVLLLQQWISTDKGPERTGEWINIVIQKHGA
ncbi:class I SAM-dependent methyltransferase [Acinetobacter oleivorans]|uniref:class I SAM-dependent methyltransferase n=1 Tax=Acinetobacter oleivorans TaxID=1148157 RepID=UPI001CD2A1D7|nr:class I SAM-dependent methyltransferase [Acinetobacter oleivorans]